MCRSSPVHRIALVLGCLSALAAPGAEDPTQVAAPGSRDRSRPVAPDVLAASVQRATRWMGTRPISELRFDSAVMLSQIRRHLDAPGVDRELARARQVADRDHDHPHRVLWVPELIVPAEVTTGWTVPAGPGRRAKPNDFLSEALHCARNGFRPETLTYLCGPVRDHGGYYTTHALWSVVLAREAGCISGVEVDRCVASMQEEILAAQPTALAPERALDTDLYAERLLTLVLSGYRGAEVGSFVRELLAQQRPDGSFAVPAGDEPASHAYHATGISAWALAAWHARRGR